MGGIHRIQLLQKMQQLNCLHKAKELLYNTGMYTKDGQLKKQFR